MAEKTVIKPKAPKPTKAVEPEVFDVQGPETNKQWGPYAEYQFVNTQYGEYAVPAGHIMTIELQKIWSAKEGRDVVRPVAKYEQVRTNDVRLKPVQARTDEERAEIANERARRGVPQRA